MKVLYFLFLYLILALAPCVIELSSPARAADSKNLPRINVGTPKQEVEKLLGPAEKTKVSNGVKIYQWNLTGNPNYISFVVAYDAKNCVGMRTLYGYGNFQAEVREATAHFGKPQLSGKEEAMWKIKTEYMVFCDQKNGIVSYTMASEEFSTKK